MRVSHLILVVLSIFLAQSAFAKKAEHTWENKACGTVAQACESAGFASVSGGKEFWTKCMKPILLAQTVKGVTVDAAVVKECRTYKVEKMKAELAELEAIK